MNGTIYRKSRYFTFSEVKYKPVPILVKKVNKINNGKKTIFQFGTYLNHTNNTHNSAREIRKSIQLVITEAVGMINRGKYTFEIRLELPTRLLLHSLSALEKNNQGSCP